MFYCKIINIICKIEENLKENNQTPQHSKTSLWGPKAEIPSAPPTSQSPSRNHYPKKKLKHQKRKQDPALNSPQKNTRMKPWCFVHNQSFCSSRYLEKYLFHLNIFCYEKSPNKRLLQDCLLKHSHKERKAIRFIFPFLMTMP